MSEIEPIVVDLVDRAIATVSESPRSVGEPGPHPCFSGPPVRDLGTQSLEYDFHVDLDTAAEEAIADLREFLIAEGLEPMEPRPMGRRTDYNFRGYGYLVTVGHVDGSSFLSIGGSTECIDP